MAFPAGVPVVIVNYKVYAEATGTRALELTTALARAAEGKRVALAVCPQAADLHRIAAATQITVLGQHVDVAKPGNGTGATLAEALAEAGATGSLLNHAERRLQLADIDAALARMRAAGLATSVVCTDNVRTTAAAATLRPTFVAIEPPELIGGDVSVTTADPGIVRDAVAAAKAVAPDVRVLCGAGVKTGDDLAVALKLGADGVLLASGVVKAKDPTAAFAQLLTGLP